MFKKINKKGQVFEAIKGLFIGLGGLVILAAIVFLIMGQVGSNTQVAADGNATAAVDTITQAAEDIPGWIPLVVIVAIGGLMFFLIRRGFGA